MEKRASPINYANQQYVLELLEKYKKSPESVDPEWALFFQGMEFASGAGPISDGGETPKELRIEALWRFYRQYGHLFAKSNPIDSESKKEIAFSDLGFSENELSQIFPTLGILSKSEAPLQEIIAKLDETYTQSIGYECFNIENKELEEWFHQTAIALTPSKNREDAFFIVSELFKAKHFEDFLQKKFLGAKRFSLEGGEAFMPMLGEIIDLAAAREYTSLFIGMAHRGRLNVLCNLLGKPYSLLMHEFNTGSLPPGSEGMGDVKYHKGFASEIETKSKKRIRAAVAPNPSHLESVDPVLLGLVKATQKLQGGTRRTLPLLIHGDASVAGQGVVYESMQLMNIDGYSVGGTIHIVINNQIGFTASPEESRSTRYPTDIAKAFGAPVIHVNAEDPLACLLAGQMAFLVRDHFGIDVFINLNCHRLWGHNEADEPRFTNPKLYQKIGEKEPVYKKFSKQMIELGRVDHESIQEMEERFKKELEVAYEDMSHFEQKELPKLTNFVKDLVEPPFDSMIETVDTGISLELLQKIGVRMSRIPDHFTPHPKLKKMFQEREKLFETGEGLIDWATAELLAYASLLKNQIHVRISGQDAKRGTFSHRHAVLIDQEHEKTYVPLNHISEDQAECAVYSSALSEYAVMGYEFGYSLGYPQGLIIWEAQFGDFVNGAQIIIDQYLASSETKWSRASGLTLFLPHGHEGMGSEHTSCRIERFLQLAALYNWRVVYPSTPAQMFHLLRKQALNPKKKPLIVATPKSMLRLSDSFSSLDELANGSFQEIIDDPDSPKKIKRVLFCMGKLYYELKKEMKKASTDHIAIIRIEELYPFHMTRCKEILESYKQAKEFCWVQEEPANQGAWEYIQPYLKEAIGEHKLHYIGRHKSPVPDTGFLALFKQQQSDLINQALHEVL